VLPPVIFTLHPAVPQEQVPPKSPVLADPLPGSYPPLLALCTFTLQFTETLLVLSSLQVIFTVAVFAPAEE